MAALDFCCCYFPKLQKQRYPEQEPCLTEAVIRSERALNGALFAPAISLLGAPNYRHGLSEEIELKCYSLANGRLLLETDRRCRLVGEQNCDGSTTRCRPIRRLEEGRSVLDVRRPDSMGLIRYRVDLASGQVSEELAIEEIGQCKFEQLHDDFHELSMSLSEQQSIITRSGCGSVQVTDSGGCQQPGGEATDCANSLAAASLIKQQIVDQLSTRSFVLVERADCNEEQPPNEADEQPDGHNYEPDPEDQYETMNECHQSVARQQLIDIVVKQRPGCRQVTTNGSKEPKKFLNSIVLRSRPLSRRPRKELGDHCSGRDASGWWLGKRAIGSKRGSKQAKPGKLSLIERLNKLLTNGYQQQQQQHRHNHRKQQPRSSSSSLAPVRKSRGLDSMRHGLLHKYRDLADPERPDNAPASWQELRQSWCLAPPLPSPLESIATRDGAPRAPALLVMISYNHKEAQEYAIALRAALGQLGVGAYLDLFEIRKGADWQDSLNLAILNCRLFVPLVTPSYGETLWTSRECKLADVLNKRIVPINFGLAWPPPSLAIQFATLQFVSWLANRTSDSEASGPNASSWPRGRDDSATPEWPADCVQAVARQLRVSLCDELRMSGAELARDCCASCGPSPAPANELASVQLSPSSLLDSGYDSPTGQLATTAAAAAAVATGAPLQHQRHRSARSQQHLRESDSILCESRRWAPASSYGSTGCTPPASPSSASSDAKPQLVDATKPRPRRKSLSISRMGRGLVKRLRRSFGAPTGQHQHQQPDSAGQRTDWRRLQPQV